MNILVPDNWLRDFLKTKATPKQIAESLSLCGPSIEKVEKNQNTSIYHVEITTNRVDTASVYGIAREAAAILPRFKLSAKLTPLKFSNLKFAKSVSPSAFWDFWGCRQHGLVNDRVRKRMSVLTSGGNHKR